MNKYKNKGMECMNSCFGISKWVQDIFAVCGKSIKRCLLLALFVGVAFSANAQANRTGYFLKGNSYRHRLNPALAVDRGYFSIPAVGNTNVSLATNLGVSDFIYPQGDRLMTFMHPDVSADEFLGNLNKNNNFNLDLDMTVFSLGFYAFGGYNTFDVGVHSHWGFNIPKDMFHFMKVMGGRDYQLSNINIYSRNYADISISHSHNITNDLTIGVRLKFLAGLAYAEMLMDKMELSVYGDQWKINAQGAAAISAMGMKLEYDEDGAISGMGGFTPGLSGIGVGADLGIVYDFSNVLTEGLILSASVCDINYMRWNNVSKVGVSPDEAYVFDGFDNIPVTSEGTAFNDQLDGVVDDLTEFFNIKDMSAGTQNDIFGATLNVGLEYKMPFYKRLSVGALYTQRLDNVYSYSGGSLMLNWSPVNFFDLAASATMSTTGFDWSAMFNIHCPGFNLYAAAGVYAGKVSKEYIPLESVNASVMFGLNIPFGKRRE